MLITKFDKYKYAKRQIYKGLSRNLSYINLHQLEFKLNHALDFFIVLYR